MPKLTVLLKHAHATYLETDDPYGLAKDLMRQRPDDRGPKHFVGADGSDIYFRPSDVIAVSVDA